MRQKINDEMRVYGINACLAIFKSRPLDIIQCFYTPELFKARSSELKQVTQFLASKKKAFHKVTRLELDKMTKSTHHEDLCMLVKKRPNQTLDQWLTRAQKSKAPQFVLALENVSNPHNLGAIVRTAAHFGVKAILLTDMKLAEMGSALRVAEGGFEAMDFLISNGFAQDLEKFTQHDFQIIATSSHAKKSLQDFSWPLRSLLILGEEGDGVTPELLKKYQTLSIDGTGAVESLNVSVAASVLMYDFHLKTKASL